MAAQIGPGPGQRDARGAEGREHMSWVQVGDSDIHYVEKGTGQPFVFLHGFGSCGEAWFQQFAAFGRRFRVIAYDSVNHGHSSVSVADEPEPDRADELEGLDRKSTRLNSSHVSISYAVFCLKK